jgi:membrane protein implicated in regulation of membrane protease activity
LDFEKRFSKIFTMKKINEQNIFLLLGLTRVNLHIFAGGILLILLGYLALAIGGKADFLSLVAGPLLLLAGYVVVIPLAILYRDKSKQKS